MLGCFYCYCRELQQTKGKVARKENIKIKLNLKNKNKKRKRSNTKLIVHGDGINMQLAQIPRVFFNFTYLN